MWQRSASSTIKRKQPLRRCPSRFEHEGYERPTAQSIEARGGVAYAAHDGVSLLGDLYLPAGAGPFPAFVAVHGGGWQAGARNAFQFWGPYLAARGYVLFAISYRLAKKGQKMFPQAVHDVRAGGQFGRGSAPQIKGDPETTGLLRSAPRAP